MLTKAGAMLCFAGMAVFLQGLDTQVLQSIRLHQKMDFGMKISAGHTYVNEGLAIRSRLCHVYVNKENSGALIEYSEQTTTWVFLLGAPTMIGCVCMSIICYIFRHTKTYIFNQKKIDISLNILNLQKDLVQKGLELPTEICKGKW